MAVTRSKGIMGGILRFLGWAVPILVWLVSYNAGIIGTVISTACTVMICSKIYISFRNKAQELSGGFDAYEGAYGALSEKEIVKIIAAEELAARTNSWSKPVSRAAVRRRVIYTVCYLILNFVFLNTLYDSGPVIPVCTLLTIVYELLFLSANTLSMIAAAAKKNPDAPISRLVANETFNDHETPKCKKLLAAGVLAMVITLAGFFGLHLQERWVFADGLGGCKVTAYMPAIISADEVQIPEKGNGKTVVAVGSGVFRNHSDLRRVSMSDSVLYIEDNAFVGCSRLEEVRLSQNLVRIGSGAFKDCSALENIELPDTLKELNGESFMGCSSLQSVVIPAGVTEIRGNTFDGCRALSSVTLHEGIIDIHAYAFQGCASLKAIELPSQITEIHAYTFENCTSLEAIAIPVGVTRIAAHAFYNCTSLSDVYIPDTVVEIGSSAFRQCASLKEIQIPAGTIVDERAFKDSPTKRYEKIFTDEQNQQVWEEVAASEAEILYYVYDIQQGPDVIFRANTDGTILMGDSERLADLIEEPMAVGRLDTYYDILEYLQKAKADGVTAVTYGVYSQTATDVVGETYMVAIYWDIDEMIAECERNIAELENE